MDTHNMDRTFEKDKNTLPARLKKEVLIAREEMLIKLTSRVTMITYLMVTGFGFLDCQTYNKSLCPILSHANPKSRTENKSLCPKGINLGQKTRHCIRFWVK